MEWADAYHERTGKWPRRDSGTIAEAPWDTWSAVNAALVQGNRGLRPGGTLIRLIEHWRGVRAIHHTSPLSYPRILDWADDHHRRTGEWPKPTSGIVLAAPHETWNAVTIALNQGLRGLPGGMTLPRLLAENRGVKNHLMAERLTYAKILKWADLHNSRTGSWPNQASGRVLNAPPGEKWRNIHAAMIGGGRGLAPGYSLAQLLLDRRGVRSKRNLPLLTKRQILIWADEHYERTGRWPGENSGQIAGAMEGERWLGVCTALSNGQRGLTGGDSLARLLARKRGHRNIAALPKLTHAQILRWADFHRTYTGAWPNQSAGPVLGAPGEKWNCIHTAMLVGNRGLPRGVSLADLLAARRGVRNPKRLPPLTTKQIVAWAQVFRKKTGRRPTCMSPPASVAPQEKWINIDNALRIGLRGLPGGSSLSRLLDKAGMDKLRSANERSN